MDEKYIKKVLDLYEKQTLDSIGDNALREVLVSGLEVALFQAAHSLEVEDQNILDKEIDYDSLLQLNRETGGNNVVKRLNRALAASNIRTYRDLMENTSDQKTQRWRKPHCLFRPWVGEKTRTLFYNHLNSLGIEIFNTPYTLEELSGSLTQ